MKQIIIYTDGACLGNPGPGGWAALLQYGDRSKELCGGATDTTNNRMELMAAIKALEAITRPSNITVYTDSQYVQKGMRDWLAGWKANGWQTKAKTPVLNQDLWQRLDAAATDHSIAWHWVKGHAGHPMNERCDGLAQQQAQQQAKRSDWGKRKPKSDSTDNSPKTV